MILGRIGRLVFLFCVVATVGAWITLDVDLGDFWFYQVWALWTLILSLAIVLRLHDLGRSGYWVVPAWLLYTAPMYVGFMVLALGVGVFEVNEAGWTAMLAIWMLYRAGLVLCMAGLVIVPISLAVLCVARGQQDVNRWGNPPGHSRPRTRRAETSNEPPVHSGSEERDEGLYLADPHLS